MSLHSWCLVYWHTYRLDRDWCTLTVWSSVTAVTHVMTSIKNIQVFTILHNCEEHIQRNCEWSLETCPAFFFGQSRSPKCSYSTQQKQLQTSNQRQLSAHPAYSADIDHGSYNNSQKSMQSATKCVCLKPFMVDQLGHSER